jgi:hypothetical protein
VHARVSKYEGDEAAETAGATVGSVDSYEVAQSIDGGGPS